MPPIHGVKLGYLNPHKTYLVGSPDAVTLPPKYWAVQDKWHLYELTKKR